MQQGEALIERKLTDGIDVLTHEVDTCDEDVNRSDLLLLIEYHLGKKPASKFKKPQLLDMWNELKTTPMINYKWDDADEAELDRLKNEDITIEHIELGWQADVCLQNFTATLSVLPEETIHQKLTDEQLQKMKSLVAETEGAIANL